MARMATVTINSTSVSPSCRPAPLRRGNLYCIIRALLNVYHGLRTGKIDRLLSSILNRSTDDLHARIPWRVGLEGQNANRSRPGHAGDPRRLRSRNNYVADSFVPMNKRNGLPVVTQKPAGIYID